MIHGWLLLSRWQRRQQFISLLQLQQPLFLPATTPMPRSRLLLPYHMPFTPPMRRCRSQQHPYLAAPLPLLLPLLGRPRQALGCPLIQTLASGLSCSQPLRLPSKLRSGLSNQRQPFVVASEDSKLKETKGGLRWMQKQTRTLCSA